MRSLVKVLFFTAVAATTLAANADTLDYTLTIGTLPGQTYTWSLPSNPTPFNPNIFGFDVLNVDIAVLPNGTPINSSLIFLTDQIHGGFAISNRDFSFIVSNGPQLFSSTTGSPTLLTGQFSLEELGPGFSATLDVVDADTPAVPEPSSLALFGTGAMMGLAALRRRFSKN